jgi:hypothetical protein
MPEPGHEDGPHARARNTTIAAMRALTHGDYHETAAIVRQQRFLPSTHAQAISRVMLALLPPISSATSA